MQLNVLDLFSGIGGFSVGLEATGKFKTIGFCEQDKFCQKVLRKRWQGTEIYEDIRNIDGTKIKADVITGGFPCQPFSTAGKRKGTEDDRYLFPEMLRIIKETQARWVVGENVQGIVNMSEGKVLQGIHNDLETIGYEVQSFIIPASSQGAWHKRNRVWIVAANTNKFGTQVQTERELSSIKMFGSSSKNRKTDATNTDSRMCRGGRTIGQSGVEQVRERIYSKKKEQTRKHFRSKTIGCDVISSKRNVSDTINIGCKGHRLQSDNLQNQSNSIENALPSFEKQQTWWETQQLICGVPNGISYELDKDRTNRVKALGNAIVPQIATEIGKAIIKAEEEIE
tara:strand:+ start:121 stop:1140 length:1020 start_codon:yes stop_codon:yes gene_type:complete